MNPMGGGQRLVSKGCPFASYHKKYVMCLLKIIITKNLTPADKLFKILIF